MVQPEEILRFWFDPAPGERALSGKRKVWFIKNPEFDREIGDRFGSVYSLAAASKLDHWQNTVEGLLALILLLDQFPRNLFRGTAQAFATDPQALALAQSAIAQGCDRSLPLVQRAFIYLPLEHSENLDHQHQNVEHCRQFLDNPDLSDFYTYAVKHCEIIQRFGRFPHRNAILGRASSPEETEFLKQPGSSF